MTYRAFALLLFTVAASCKEDSVEYIIHVENSDLVVRLENERKFHALKCYDRDSLTSSWPLPYPVYQLQKGDIDQNGVEDILVGVIKPTRNDSVTRKRLFVFQVRNKRIIPLWLGSSLSHPLEDFRVIQYPPATVVVRSLERETDGTFLLAEYQWLGFGLSFNKYLNRNISLEEAKEMLAD